VQGRNRRERGTPDALLISPEFTDKRGVRMLAPVVQFVRSALIRYGRMDVTRFVPRFHPLARRGRLIDSHGVGVVLDVGANTGQYGAELRGLLGYRGRIVSFEPLESAFAALERRTRHDPNWQAVHTAVGAAEGELEINVAGNSTSSSLLPMLALHEQTAPESRYVGKERVTVRPLDALAAEHFSPRDVVFLKIDVQGYEARVLDGAVQTLPRIEGIQIELSLTPLYDGAPSYLELCQRIEALGLHLAALEPGLVEPKSGRLLQVDAIFFR
jgi:FkbM family methyltransferase